MLATLPFPLFIRLLSLLNLGWFGLGLFTLVISTFSRRSIVGFLAGVALNFVGLIIYKGSFSPAITSLSFPQHMILNLQYAKMQELLPVSSFHFALLYWSFWILLLLLSGMQLGKGKTSLEVLICDEETIDYKGHFLQFTYIYSLASRLFIWFVLCS